MCFSAGSLFSIDTFAAISTLLVGIGVRLGRYGGFFRRHRNLSVSRLAWSALADANKDLIDLQIQSQGRS